MSETIDFWRSLYKQGKSEYIYERLNNTSNISQKVKILKLTEFNYILKLSEDILTKETISILKNKIGRKNIEIMRSKIEKAETENQKKGIIDELWLILGTEVTKYLNTIYDNVFDNKEISLMWSIIIDKLLE